MYAWQCAAETVDAFRIDVGWFVCGNRPLRAAQSASAATRVRSCYRRTSQRSPGGVNHGQCRVHDRCSSLKPLHFLTAANRVTGGYRPCHSAIRVSRMIGAVSRDQPSGAALGLRVLMDRTVGTTAQTRKADHAVTARLCLGNVRAERLHFENSRPSGWDRHGRQGTGSRVPHTSHGLRRTYAIPQLSCIPEASKRTRDCAHISFQKSASHDVSL